MTEAPGYRDLVERLDGLEVVQARHRTELDRLSETAETVTDHAEHLEELTTQVQELTRRAKAARPVDWLTVDDPDKAVSILTRLVTWHDTFLPFLGSAIRFPCWPWHPLAVVETLALADYHAAAYAGPPTAPADYLNRILPAYRKRLLDADTARGACGGTLHQPSATDTKRQFNFDLNLLPDYAAWWAGPRQGTPPGLTPLTTD